MLNKSFADSSIWLFIFCKILFLIFLTGCCIADELNPDAERDEWSIHGNVCDTNGKPVSGVYIHVRPKPGIGGSFLYVEGYSVPKPTYTDGKYVMPIEPGYIYSKSGLSTPPGNEFRFLPLVAEVSHPGDEMDGKFYVLKEKSRSMNGELIVVGNSARPEDVSEMKKYFAGINFDVVFVSKNTPLQIDFIVEPTDFASTYNYYSPWPADYWINKAEYDKRDEVYRKIGFKKEETELTSMISAYLRFPKPEIEPGEQITFEYVVRNNSDTDIYINADDARERYITADGVHVYYIPIGGFPGRSEYFTMQAVQKKDGGLEKTIYEIPVRPPSGSITPIPSSQQREASARIAAGGEYAFDILLNSWLDLNEPGEYRIEVARYLDPSLNGENRESLCIGSCISSILRIASGILAVKSFDEK